MTSQVDVRAVERLREFQTELAAFCRDAQKVAESALNTVGQLQDWLDQEARYWSAMRRRCEDELSLARTELNRVRIATPPKQPPRDTDARLAVQRARRRLDHCEQALAELRALKQELLAASDELRKGLAPLSRHVAGPAPKAVTKLEEILRRIEAYLQPQPPGVDVRPQAGQDDS